MSAIDQLALSLRTLNPKDPDQLLGVAECYEKIGNAKKAQEYRARAENLRSGEG